MAFRTQKISQMTPKGADLEATDLIEVSTIESGSYVTRSITGQELIDAIPLPPTGLTVGTTPISSGTIGRVLFQGTGNVLQQSSSLFWDATNNRLGIGTSSPAYTIDSIGTIKMSALFGKGIGTSDRYFTFDLEKPTGTIPSIVFGAYDDNSTRYLSFGGEAGSTKYATQYLYFFTGATNTTVAGTRAMAILPSGNINIGSSITDAGFRLDVNGTARVQNTTTITKGASNYITFEPSANGTSPFLDMFFSGQVSTRISLGTTSSTRVFLFRDLGTALGMGIDCGAIFSNSNAILIGGAEQKVQIAGTTNNYLQFTQAGTANRGTIGYAAGQSYMQIRVNGATDLATGTLSTAFFSTGNVGINTTTDAGFRLDVNGTARVSGVFSVGADTARIDLWRSSGAFGGRIGTGYSNPAVNHVYIQCDTNSKAILIDDSNRTLFSSSNGDTTTASAQVTINSTTRGFLPPRMTTTQINAIASPAEGLMVYNTTISHMCVYQAGSWVKLSHSPM